MNNTVKLTNDEFKNKLSKIFPNYLPKQDYINYRTKLMMTCNIHNLDFLANPHSILIEGKHQCPECIKFNRLEKFYNYVKIIIRI